MKLMAILLTAALSGGIALAQEPVIPVELRSPNSIRLDGTNLTFCITTGGPIEDFERAVAGAVAQSLLLEPVFVDVSGNFPLYEETDLLTTVYQLLNEQCEAFIGFNLLSGIYPTWLALSRPYISVPYVFAVADSAYDSLADVPQDRPIGTPMMSVAESAYVTYALTLPVNQRWQRFPYADDVLMLQRVIDGTIAGAFFWVPSLSESIAALGDQAGEVRSVPTEPVRVPPSLVGFAVLANQSFLLNALDQAIVALGEDGTLEALMAEYGIPGQAAP